jgi:hypothetical protein
MAFVRIEPQDIVPARGGGHLIRTAPEHSGRANCLMAITVDWCRFCRDLKDSVSVAMAVQPFTYMYMPGDTLEAKWKMRDLGCRTYPSVFVVSPDGTIGPRYEGKREPADLLKALRLGPPAKISASI